MEKVSCLRKRSAARRETASTRHLPKQIRSSSIVLVQAKVQHKHQFAKARQFHHIPSKQPEPAASPRTTSLDLKQTPQLHTNHSALPQHTPLTRRRTVKPNVVIIAVAQKWQTSISHSTGVLPV